MQSDRGKASVGHVRALGPLLLVTVLLFAPPAPAANPPERAAALKVAMEHEFTAAGDALRERLNHLAANDALGAALAEREAAEHRSRYLDLKARLDALTASRAGLSPVAAFRDPFAHAAEVPSRPALEARAQDTGTEGLRATWDLYAAHPGSGTGTQNSFAARDAVAVPAEPFLVYRAPHQGDAH